MIAFNEEKPDPDDSSLTIYCRTQARLYGTNTQVNPDTSDPSKLKIYMLGNDIWNDPEALAALPRAERRHMQGAIFVSRRQASDAEKDFIDRYRQSADGCVTNSRI